MASGISNVMRIGGLSSGLDIDQIVSDLMKAERAKVDKLYQQKTLLEWQQEDYRNVNLKLKALYDNVFNMKLQGTYLKYKSTASLSDGTSADSYVSVTAGSTALPGNYTLKINQLATSAQITSSDSISKALEGNSLTYPVTIDSNNYKFVISLDGVEKTVELTQRVYDGVSFTLNDLKNDIQSKIDSLFGANQITVGLNGDKLTFEPAGAYKPSIVLKNSSDANALDDIGFTDGSSYKINIYSPLRTEYTKFKNSPFGGGNFGVLSFTINGKTFSFDFSDTGNEKNYSLADVLSRINSDADAKVYAYYDSVTDKIVFKSKESGIDSKVEITNISGNLFGPNGALSIDSGASATGQNASIVFNGTTITKSDNTFTLNGIQLTLKKADSTKDINIFVEQDVDGVVESIKNFIKTYNDTIDYINGKLSEERYYDYPPLTDDQKKEMKDSDIEKWEQKARSGLLRSDPLVSGIVNRMRQAIYSTVEGLPSGFNNLSAIGITTGSYKEKGKLYLDETKLREALSKDPNSVMRLFTNDDQNDNDKDGIAVRLYNEISNGMNSITRQAGGGDYQIYDNSFLANRIREVNERILDWEDRLIDIENRYWNKFTQMEKAISAMNQQSAWLSAQLSSIAGK